MAQFPPDFEFLAGIENGGVDFSAIEYIITNEGGNVQNFGFGDLTAHPQGGKLLNVTLETKGNSGHSLPESPPDSEHPYSPQDGCEARLNTSDGGVYTTNLVQNIYKEEIFNPIGNFLSSPAVVLDQNSQGLVDENGILQDDRLSALPSNCRILEEGLASTEHSGILTDNVPDNQQILLQNVQSEPSSSAFGRSLYQQNEFSADGKHLVNFTIAQGMENLDSMDNNMEGDLPRVYTNVQNAFKKRKLSQDSLHVKNEPDHCPAAQLSPSEPFAAQADEEYAGSESCLTESPYQCIRFSPFQQSNWHVLCDQNLADVATPQYKVDADKGFNFSNADDAFVCQKKNHFQVTCHVQLLGDAQFVRTPDGLKKIVSFYLHFYGVKHDCPTQTIRVEQSQSDRSKKPFHPVLVELVKSQVTKVTVGRLHFSETTSNNMRKKGKPNPEQRYFQLVVGLHAHTTNGNFPVVSHASQKIIVRASNPGQFESDVELCWQKGQNPDTVFHNGKVGINTDRPDESLVVHGNIRLNGHLVHPSDVRAKKNIVELNSAEQLRNVQKLRVVRYEYEPSLASQLCREREFTDTGVIAQEVAQVLPEAVKPAGDLILENGTSINNFLVVNKERIFMENIGAVKELCKVTDNLETRIEQLERINLRLNKLKRGDSLKSDSTVNSSKRSHSSVHCKCSKRHRCKYCERQEEELCSNKFIQIVITVLVLIMALCLTAITALYLIDAGQPNRVFENLTNIYTTKKTSFAPKSTTKPPPIPTDIDSSTVAVNRNPQPSSSPKQHHWQSDHITVSIGSPSECQEVQQSLLAHYCQPHCCAPVNLQSHADKHPVNDNKNKTVMTFKEQQNSPVTEDKSRDLSTNDIDRSQRNSRDTYDMSYLSDLNELSDNEQITLIVQGTTTSFNITLGEKYLLSGYHPTYNKSFDIPVSKYMPDPFVKLIFKFNQGNVTKIHNCPNEIREDACILPMADDEEKTAVDQAEPSESGSSITYQVMMNDFQSKVMTYRASVNVSHPYQENLCSLSDDALGSKFVIYNFYFHRQCMD